jgi:hypothetical protein
MEIKVGDRVQILTKNAHLYPMPQFHYAGHTGTVVNIYAMYPDSPKHYHVSPDNPLSGADRVSGVPYYSEELKKIDE